MGHRRTNITPGIHQHPVGTAVRVQGRLPSSRSPSYAVMAVKFQPSPINMDVLNVDTPDVVGKRSVLFAARPTIYILVVLTAVLLAQAYTLRKTGIFSCKASGYSADYYLDYCQATAYGDYEHGAFWFGLEPSALSSASKAQALFLGDSRLQFAFSTAATAGWFSNAVTRYYLLGFGYGGNVAFEGELLRKVKPQAKLYVMTVDFFERTESPPAREVMHTPGARSRYQVKRLWQLVHAPICKAVPAICANQYALFRSRETGAYITRQSGSAQRPVSYDPVVDQETVNKYVASGRDFLSHLPVKRECVVLTQIPTVGTRNKAAVAVATALGINLVAPEPDGLQTFDGVHLERSSAERWSKAFFEAAGAQIRGCLEASRAAPL